MRRVCHTLIISILSLLALALAIIPALNHHAQPADGWPVTTACAPDEAAPPPGWTFPGVIVSVAPTDGVRALRATVATTYYIAFAGSAFVQAGALSPDGRWYAFPYGTLQTAATSDNRTLVQEIRVHSTDRVPQLRRRIPWQATFQAGTPIRPGDPTDPPALRWLDAETLLYAQGTVSGGYSYALLRPFAETVTPVPSDIGQYPHLAPDLKRGLRLTEGAWGLFDLTNGALLRRFPALADGLTVFAWSPDAARLLTVTAADGVRRLVLLDRDGVSAEVVLTFPVELAPRNIAWSPDGTRFAFSLFDPQADENRLHIADVAAQTITDACLLLARDVRALAWSPDGTALALVTASSRVSRVQIYDLRANVRYAVAGYSGALVGWGAWE